MPVEIEAKMRVKDLAAVRDKLKSVGAKQKSQVVETNTFFDREDRSLLAADQGLRLRVNRPANGGDATYIITFKGPRLHGILKSRDETELKVENDRDAIALLHCLGFHRVRSFEKRRESWSLMGCSIELDELPYLGAFVEIEGPNDEEVLKVRTHLDLSNEPIVRASYIALLTTYLQEKGLQAQKEITF
ncbi:MAG: class IV adenylate cyclase [Phycisphaerae bacterium]|nr:class IV adenylate cyclase [Phycisphaerae bacterium]